MQHKKQEYCSSTQFYKLPVAGGQTKIINLDLDAMADFIHINTAVQKIVVCLLCKAVNIHLGENL